MTDISVVGTGYVGLVSGVCLAERGHTVVCVDIDQEKVDRINRGECPIHEPGLPELLERHVGRRFRATTDLAEAVETTAVSLIAVGTPFDGERIDLRHVKAAARQIGAALADKDGYHVVAVKSTVVPGTTDGTVLPLLERHSGKRAGADFGVGANPEFLREGQAVQDFLEPDRIVVGALDERTESELEAVYGVFPDVPLLTTTTATAEMIKYASNSLFATLISFSNEIGNLCARLDGTDVVDVMRGVHLDRRLSPRLPGGERITAPVTHYLEAGCGFGGSCFPKDVRALVAHGKSAGEPMRILDAAVTMNEEQPLQMVRLLERHFASLEGVRVAVLGLAFKPGTDDVRGSPAIPVISELASRGALLRAFDPAVGRLPVEIPSVNGAVEYCADVASALANVDAVLIVTRWEEFGELPELLDGEDPPPVVVDGRRMLEKDAVPRYEGIGL